MAERRIKALLDAAAGASAVGLLGAVKRLDRKRTANGAGARSLVPFNARIWVAR